MKKEISILENIFTNLRGYHLLLIGNFLKLSELPKHCLHSFGLSPEGPSENTDVWVQSYYDSLPFGENSIDAVLIPYEPLTESLLQELHRCLIGEGRVFIFGNILSILHTKKLLDQTHFMTIKTRYFNYGLKYFIEAQKRVHIITPVRPAWEIPVFEKEWVKPVSRKMLKCKR